MSCCCCLPGQCCAVYQAANNGISSTASGAPFTAYNEIAADTLGVVYRAFSSRPKWLGGSGSPSVDPWTKQILKDNEQYQLQKAGMAADQAKAQACKDIEKTIATAPSLQPCACTQPNYFVIIGIIAALAIAVIIFSNVAAHRALD